MADVIAGGTLNVSLFSEDGRTEVGTPTAPLHVRGPLTDGELRAAPVPVDGPLTDAQLRATPVVVDTELSAAGPLATEATAAGLRDDSNTHFGTEGAGPPTIPGTGVRGYLRSIYDRLGGTLTTSRTWALAAGTDTVTVVQAGTVNTDVSDRAGRALGNVAVTAIPEVEVKNDAGNPLSVTATNAYATEATQSTAVTRLTEVRDRVGTETTQQTVLTRLTETRDRLPAGGAATETTAAGIRTDLGTDGATPPTIPGTGVRGWLRSIYDRLGNGSARVVVDSGSIEVANDVGNPLPVSGTVTANTGLTQPLTDAQLRATAVPVSGPLTDAQLRATAVPVTVGNNQGAVATGPGTVTFGTTPSQLVAANPRRVAITIQNNSVTDVYVSYGTGTGLTTTNGLRVPANGGLLQESDFTGAIFGMASVSVACPLIEVSS